MDTIFESYKNSLTTEQEARILEQVEQLDEFVLAAIGTILAAGLVLRVVDGIMGNKPKVINYMTALLRWATDEYSEGLNVVEIRKYAYEALESGKEISDNRDKTVSKILSKKLTAGLKKGSKEFAKILGQAIGRIAKEAGLKRTDIDKALPAT